MRIKSNEGLGIVVYQVRLKPKLYLIPPDLSAVSIVESIKLLTAGH